MRQSNKIEVSKSIYHALNVKLPQNVMIITNENEGLCGQFCEFQVKIDEKFDVWMVN